MGLYDAVPFNPETNQDQLKDPFELLQKDTLSHRSPTVNGNLGKQHLFGAQRKIETGRSVTQIKNNRFEDVN